MEGIVYPVVVAVILACIGWFAGRFSVKTKTQVAIEDMRKRLDKVEKAVPLLLRGNLDILVALKRGEVNGECDQALEDLNDYLIDGK